MAQQSSEEKQKFGTITKTFYTAFVKAYQGRVSDTPLIRDLPMLTRAWRVWFVDARRTWVILEYCPRSFNPIYYEVHTVPQRQFPALAGLDNGEAIAELIGLNDIAGAMPFPLGLIPDQPSPAYLEQVEAWAVAWGSELADAHVARARAPFDEAKERMMRAYGKLFELEQKLRLFIQQRLEALYTSGWWDKVDGATRTLVEKREKEALNLWFDDFSPSRLKFADFDGLRLTVIRNWNDFNSILGDKEAFQSNMIWLSRARNRIAHANTLSQEDYQEFLTQANRILDLVTPHVRL